MKNIIAIIIAAVALAGCSATTSGGYTVSTSISKGSISPKIDFARNRILR